MAHFTDYGWPPRQHNCRSSKPSDKQMWGDGSGSKYRAVDLDTGKECFISEALSLVYDIPCPAGWYGSIRPKFKARSFNPKPHHWIYSPGNPGVQELVYNMAGI